MKKLLDILMGRPSEVEQTIGQKLRAEARLIESAAPADTRRRVMEKIASLEPTAGSTMNWRWIGAGTTVATAIVLAAVLLHGPKPPVSTPQDDSHYVMSIPSPELPVATVQHWVAEPMQSELRQLLDGLDSTKETLRSILPAAPTKQKNDSTGKADSLSSGESA